MKFLITLFCLLTNLATCQTRDEYAICTCNPDPHFHTFSGEYYDYHAECDLVLVTNDLLDLHIRTDNKPGYASVSQAVLSISGDVVEIHENGDVIVNGGTAGTAVPALVGGYSASTTVSGASTIHEVTLDGGQYVRIRQWYGSLSIEVNGHGSDFQGSLGLCGSWTTPPGDTFLKRDLTIESDMVVFGNDWMVQASDPPLFSTPGANECKPSRGHGGGGHDGPRGGNRKFAEEACADVPEGPVHNNCVFDVIVTNDPVFAEHPFYLVPPVAQKFCEQVDECKALGGKCVFACDETMNDCYDECDCKQDVCSCAVPKTCPKDDRCTKLGGKCLPYCHSDATFCIDELCGDVNDKCICNLKC